MAPPRVPTKWRVWKWNRVWKDLEGSGAEPSEGWVVFFFSTEEGHLRGTDDVALGAGGLQEGR